MCVSAKNSKKGLEKTKSFEKKAMKTMETRNAFKKTCRRFSVFWIFFVEKKQTDRRQLCGDLVSTRNGIWAGLSYVFSKFGIFTYPMLLTPTEGEQADTTT